MVRTDAAHEYYHDDHHHQLVDMIPSNILLQSSPPHCKHPYAFSVQQSNDDSPIFVGDLSGACWTLSGDYDDGLAFAADDLSTTSSITQDDSDYIYHRRRDNILRGERSNKKKPGWELREAAKNKATPLVQPTRSWNPGSSHDDTADDDDEDCFCDDDKSKTSVLSKRGNCIKKSLESKPLNYLPSLFASDEKCSRVALVIASKKQPPAQSQSPIPKQSLGRTFESLSTPPPSSSDVKKSWRERSKPVGLSEESWHSSLPSLFTSTSPRIPARKMTPLAAPKIPTRKMTPPPRIVPTLKTTREESWHTSVPSLFTSTSPRAPTRTLNPPAERIPTLQTTKLIEQQQRQQHHRQQRTTMRSSSPFTK
jgi:hypothetical protein